MYLFNEIGDVVFDHTGKFEIVRETFFGGAHIEGESFDEEFRDEVEKKVHDLKENKSKVWMSFSTGSLHMTISQNIGFRARWV